MLLRILIVEDEPLIAMTVEDMLDELGYSVAGTVGRLDDALAFVRANPVDGALLDVNLGRDKIDPVADLLASKSCPFVFATGDGRMGLPSAHAARPWVAKPFRMEDLSRALAEAFPDVRKP